MDLNIKEMMDFRLNMMLAGLLLLCAFCHSGTAEELNTTNGNHAPDIENMQVVVDAGKKQAVITYDVSDSDNNQLEVQLSVSNDYGKSFTVYMTDVSGDVGFPVTPGKGRKITWKFPSFIHDIDSYYFRLLATDREPVAVEELVAGVSEERIKQDIETLVGPRDHLSDAGRNNLKALQKALRKEIRKRGLVYSVQSFKSKNMMGKNVLGKIKGHDQESEVIILGAHMDTVEGSPGADDNTSGVVGMMEAMRILSEYQFDKTIVFAGWDLEEKGNLGSYAYVIRGGIKLYERVNCYVNLDMIGTFKEEKNTQIIPEGFDQVFPEVARFVKKNENRGDFLVCISNENSEAYLSRLEQSMTSYVPSLKWARLVVEGYGTDAPRLRDSDHASFWDYDIPALFLGDGAETRNQNLDTPKDVVNDLNLSKMTEVVKTLVAFLATEAKPIHGDVEIKKRVLMQ